MRSNNKATPLNNPWSFLHQFLIEPSYFGATSNKTFCWNSSGLKIRFLILREKSFFSRALAENLNKATSKQGRGKPSCCFRRPFFTLCMLGSTIRFPPTSDWLIGECLTPNRRPACHFLIRCLSFLLRRPQGQAQTPSRPSKARV